MRKKTIILINFIIFLCICVIYPIKVHAEERKDGWYIKDNEWHYYLSEDNHDISDGWYQIDGVWYAFQNNALACGEWVDGYYADYNGEYTYYAYGTWIKDEKGWYFIDSEGWYPKSEGEWIDGFFYEFDSDGYLIESNWGNDTGTSNVRAYYDSDGHQLRGGMKFIDGKLYRFYTEGSGHQKYSYTLTDEIYDSSNGWHNASNNNASQWYYVESGDLVRSCWKIIDGYWYYFDYNGFISTDCWRDGYYLSSDGRQTYAYVAKWYYDSKTNKSYYMDSSGWYATGNVNIDGVDTFFDENGYTSEGPGLAEFK